MKKQTDHKGKKHNQHKTGWQGTLRITYVCTPDAATRLNRAIDILLLSAEKTTPPRSGMTTKKGKRTTPQPLNGSTNGILGKQ